MSRSIARISLLFCILALPLWTPSSDAAGTLRCGAWVVEEGRTSVEVKSVCGEPSYRDVWAAAQGGPQSYRADTEEWYYDFGPDQLLRLLRLHDGRVVEIDFDGYGFGSGQIKGGDQACAAKAIRPGISKYRLLRLCGQPTQLKANHVMVPLRSRRTMNQFYNPSRRREEYVSVGYREEWVYNFGSRYLTRIVKLENGRVTNVENGDRGTD